MSLLTPSESRAFQSFLDATTFPVDWSMQLEISHEHMPPARGTEALAKATKDLMSLDGDNWRFPSLGPTAATSTHWEQQVQNNPLALVYSARHQRSLGDDADETEQVNPSSTRMGSSAQFRVPKSTADSKRTRADPCSFDHSSSSPSSSSSRQSPADLLISSSTAKLSSAKRSPPSDAKLSNKRHRPSPPSLDLTDEMQALPANKIALLSPSQKKANHIQSEQKRRANIRRGYDALCDAVPALREACQVEEEQQLAEGRSKNRRKGRGKAKCDDAEKVDGRAGPRSENVVLSKTIDYLHELLSEREVLMQRLQAARNSLPAKHSLIQPRPDAPLPLWERKWSGGEQKGNDDDDDDDDD